MTIMSLRCCLALAALHLASGGSPQPSLTPVQQNILDQARAEAQRTSLEAESTLLSRLSTEEFKLSLLVEGSRELVTITPARLLDALRASLGSLEYTFNFGLDVQSLRKHPGQTALDLDTIDAFGYFPNQWELLVNKSRLAANTSRAQWSILDAAETGLYAFPSFQVPGQPTAEEAQLRPQYLAGNLRRSDDGTPRYGAYTAVLRNDVVRRRAILIGNDSGGWENVCNTSVVPIHPFYHLFRHAFPCDAVFAGESAERPMHGVLDHQVHTMIANSDAFGHYGGSLPRVLYQLLVPNATVRPIETNMYTEAALLGSLMPADVKLLVGNFPGLFGTPEGLKLRNFCNRHEIPLAWALGSGRDWPDDEADSKEWFPLEPFETWKAGQPRLLDPEVGWAATNITAPSDPHHVWDIVWDEVVASRNSTIDGAGKPTQGQFQGWWGRLRGVAPDVRPLRAFDCASADFCFGTTTKSPNGAEGLGDCVCRRPPPPAAAAAAGGGGGEEGQGRRRSVVV